MVKEIYVRTPDDPYYEEGIVDYTNELESVLSQIKILLGTNKGEVLGAYNFGVDLEYLVFNTKKNADEILEQINEQILDNVYHSPKTTINTAINFGDSGEGYDIAVIDIYINGQKAIGFLVDKENNK